MTVATITTDINIGPFKIPSNGQNMIMNNYAQRNNIIVELVIPEPMMSQALATVQWIHKENKLTEVILSSIHQLPVDEDRINELLNLEVDMIARYVSNYVNINKLLGISLVCAGIFIIIFSFVNNYMLGMILYSVIFAFGAASENALSTLLQNSVPDTMRGRAISLQALIWGFSGFSGLLGGYLSEIYGIQIVILISGIVLILISPIIKPISSNSQRMQIM